MSDLPKCPKCDSPFTYEDGDNYVCPECAWEWSKTATAEAGEQAKVFKDAFGNVLVDGDTVTVIKDLKIKGSSSVVKVGTKVKNIRLVDGDHDIDCKIDGIGAMQLKTEFVKKALGLHMSGWGCPHEVDEKCQKVLNKPCDIGMKGCVLFGRFRFADESKNRPQQKAMSEAADQSTTMTRPDKD